MYLDMVEESRSSAEIARELARSDRFSSANDWTVAQLATPVAGNICGAAVFAWLVWSSVPTNAVLLWLAGQTVLALCILRCGLGLHPDRKASEASRRRLEIGYSLAHGLEGILWGSTLVVAAGADITFALKSLVLLVACTAGSVGIPTPSMRNSLSLLGPMWGVASIGLFLHGHVHLLVGSVLFAGIMLHNSVVAVGMLRETIDLKLRAHDLATSLSREAQTDALTGLLNRSGFADQSVARLADVDADSQVSLLFIDLDFFKEVNDTHGHNVGDLVLSGTASRLAEAIRNCSSVQELALPARIGGDEFVVFVNGESAIAVDKLAALIISAIEQPYVVDGAVIRISASIGIRTMAAKEFNVSRALVDADFALYSAKRTGRRKAARFETQHLERCVGLDFELREAVAQGKLSAFAQPIFSLSRAQPTGVELLCRWIDDKRGTQIPPSVFIPMAERLGIIDDIDIMMVKHAVETIEAWSEKPELSELLVGVNISSPVLTSNKLAAALEQAERRLGASVNRLVIEVTESETIHDRSAAETAMQTFQKLGIRVVLDDFGTGFASLNSLVDLPFSAVKIDQGLIQNVAANPRFGLAVRAVNSLAEQLNLPIVAEGVETDAQREWVQAAGIDLVQGYLFSRPLPIHEMAAWCTSRRLPAPA